MAIADGKQLLIVGEDGAPLQPHALSARDDTPEVEYPADLQAAARIGLAAHLGAVIPEDSIDEDMLETLRAP